MAEECLSLDTWQIQESNYLLQHCDCLLVDQSMIYNDDLGQKRRACGRSSRGTRWWSCLAVIGQKLSCNQLRISFAPRSAQRNGSDSLRSRMHNADRGRLGTVVRFAGCGTSRCCIQSFRQNFSLALQRPNRGSLALSQLVTVAWYCRSES